MKDDVVESVAYASALYWACEDGTWCQLRGTKWRCLRVAPSGLVHSAAPDARDASWRPWTRLIDTSAHPQGTVFELDLHHHFRKYVTQVCNMVFGGNNKYSIQRGGRACVGLA